jgi:predicted RecB family nuclease
MEQDAIEIAMQGELDIIAAKMDNMVFSDYCAYEDEVGKFIDRYCPVCKREIRNTGIGISILMANIRNYIRSKCNIIFE